MSMYNSREATLKAVTNFPRSMDIRKRLWKSLGGKYLQSLMEEQEEFIKAYEEFKSEFFLKTYLGHEDEVLCHVYIAQVGDATGMVSADDRYEITLNPHVFVANTKKYALWQSGMLLLDPDLVDDESPVIKYRIGNETFTVIAQKQALWNIFDEFAMFSSLMRYEGETNSELVKRILATFKRPANSTETGLKNAIINAVMNFEEVAPDEIIMERPNGINMALETSNGNTVYDALSVLNKDIAREKIWNHSTWENGFKKMQYIPITWDMPIKGYQDGTGQKNDLETKLSTDYADEDTTDIEVVGYSTSQATINQYIRKQGIRKTIPIQLFRYQNELIPQDVQYKITATPATEIDPTQIFVESIQHATGEQTLRLSDIVINSGNIKKVQRGEIGATGKYQLKFVARDSYSDMIINRCSFTETGSDTAKDLLEPQNGFRWDNGVFRNTDVALHATTLSSFTSSWNMQNDASGGICLGTDSTRGTLVVNVAGMGGLPIQVKAECAKTDYTSNTSFVTLTGGFHYTNNEMDIICDTSDSESECIIEMDCVSLSYELALADSPINQGTISVKTEIEGEVSAQHSGIFSDGKVYELEFENLTHVKLSITKVGLYPVTLRNIKAARYRISFKLDKGDLIYTQQYTKLPLDINSTRLLTVTLESFSTYTPVIKYIHIGPSMARSSYEVRINTMRGGIFNIDTNCRVELYYINGGSLELINEDFITYPLYRNNHSEASGMFIDTSSFLDIRSSSRPIYSGVYKGNIMNYIELGPGEELDSITIAGEQRIVKEHRSLSYFLQKNIGDKVYIAGNAPGFVVVDDLGDTNLINIKKDDFGRNADEYRFTNVPEGISGVFILNSETKIKNISNSYSGEFEYFYLAALSPNSYIAYNSVTMFQSPMDHVDLVNTFSPYLDMNQLMFYHIDEIIVNEEKGRAKASFIHVDVDGTHYHDWAIGGNHKGIRVEYDFDYSNSEGYKIDITNLNESFLVSNNIELKDSYTIDNKDYILARYILKPPAEMKITYSTETVQEDFYIEEDGFNKFYYSNVTSILSVTLGNGEKFPYGSYHLLVEPGIIIWKNASEYQGQLVSVVYEYKKPRSIEYRNLSYLYEMINYSVDAYMPINSKPMVIKDLADGDSRMITINGKKPDKITVKCSNSNFAAAVSGNKVSVRRFSTAVVGMVHTGYFYDGGKEYYLFEHDRQELANCWENIEAKNVQHIANTMRTMQKSGNYVYDSAMFNGDHLEKVCSIDCAEHQERIQGISEFREITACESYQMWTDFGMYVEMVPGYNGNGLRFTTQGEYGYAYLDITSYINEGMELSFYADDGIQAYIMEEILAGDDSMIRSVFAGQHKKMPRNGKFLWHVFNNIDNKKRYYLLVKGSGMVDDLIIHENSDAHKIEDIHHKVISILHFNVKEEASKNYLAKLDFNPDGTTYDGLEISKNGIVETSSTVDWGVTLISKLDNLFESFSVMGADLRKNTFMTFDKSGNITSPWINIHDYQTVDTIYVKINDMLIDPMRYFNVRVYTASTSLGDHARQIYSTTKTNLVEFRPTSLLPYIQVAVEMPPGRVINNIEIYVRYVENAIPLHVSQTPSGTLVTKLYDTAVAANYRLKYMTGSVTRPNDISISVRGYRQDDGYGVFTQWYPSSFDDSMRFAGDQHVFENYRYFQFKIEISDMNASIRIDQVIFEVV